MAEITDKELLSICNLTNLKLEFANLKVDGKLGEESESKNLPNHTI